MNGTPLAVQPIPKPAEKPAANSNSHPAVALAAPGGKAPKLVAPAAKLDFGKQPQDKTLVRAIVISNRGTDSLKIESVTPS